jgi:5-dehydro-2-deoxygluconokinase
VGGSPTNIAVGASKLGLNTALLTAVGQDPVGDFVLNYLTEVKVDTRFIPAKPGRRTSCVILGIEPPDKFLLVYYRDNCADNALTIDDADLLPLDKTAVFVVTGTNLSQETSRSATLYAVEKAHRQGAQVVLDIDFRADLWTDVRYFGSAIRSLIPLVDVVIGTEDEINAVLRTDSGDVDLTHSQVSDTRVTGDSQANARVLMASGPQVVVVKQGQHGCQVYEQGDEPTTVPGFPVKILNILGPAMPLLPGSSAA